MRMKSGEEEEEEEEGRRKRKRRMKASQALYCIAAVSYNFMEQT